MPVMIDMPPAPPAEPTATPYCLRPRAFQIIGVIAKFLVELTIMVLWLPDGARVNARNISLAAARGVLYLIASGLGYSLVLTIQAQGAPEEQTWVTSSISDALGVPEMRCEPISRVKRGTLDFLFPETSLAELNTSLELTQVSASSISKTLSTSYPPPTSGDLTWNLKINTTTASMQSEYEPDARINQTQNKFVDLELRTQTHGSTTKPSSEPASKMSTLGWDSPDQATSASTPLFDNSNESSASTLSSTDPALLLGSTTQTPRHNQEEETSEEEKRFETSSQKEEDRIETSSQRPSAEKTQASADDDGTKANSASYTQEEEPFEQGFETSSQQPSAATIKASADVDGAKADPAIKPTHSTNLEVIVPTMTLTTKDSPMTACTLKHWVIVATVGSSAAMLALVLGFACGWKMSSCKKSQEPTTSNIVPPSLKRVASVGKGGVDLAHLDDIPLDAAL